jgi:hypothetical protein
MGGWAKRREGASGWLCMIGLRVSSLATSTVLAIKIYSVSVERAG